MREEKQIQSIYVDYHTYIIHRNPTFSCTNFYLLIYYTHFNVITLLKAGVSKTKLFVPIGFLLKRKKKILFEYQKRLLNLLQ